MNILNIVVHYVTAKNVPFVNTAVKIDPSKHSSKTLAALIREEVCKKKPCFVYSDRDVDFLETGDGVDILTFLEDPFSAWGDFVTSSESKRNAIIAVINPPLVNSDSEDENDTEVTASGKVMDESKVNNSRSELDTEEIDEGIVRKTIKTAQETSTYDSANALISVDDSEEESVIDSKKKAKKKKSTKKKKKKGKKKKKDKKETKQDREVRKEESKQDCSDIVSKQTKKRPYEYATSTTTEMENEGLVAQKRRKIETHTSEPSTERAAVRASSKIEKKIIVGGISFSETKEQVRQYFSQWGDVGYVEIIYQQNEHKVAKIMMEFATKEDCAVFNTESCINTNSNKLYFKADKKIHVFGIPKSTKETQIRQFFNKWGKITDLQMGFICCFGIRKSTANSQIRQHFNKWGEITDIRMGVRPYLSCTIAFATNEAREACIAANGGSSHNGLPSQMYFDKKYLAIEAIPDSTTGSEVKEYFSRWGKITYFNISNKSAILVFATIEEREACIAENVRCGSFDDHMPVIHYKNSTNANQDKIAQQKKNASSASTNPNKLNAGSKKKS